MEEFDCDALNDLIGAVYLSNSNDFDHVSINNGTLNQVESEKNAEKKVVNAPTKIMSESEKRESLKREFNCFQMRSGESFDALIVRYSKLVREMKHIGIVYTEGDYIDILADVLMKSSPKYWGDIILTLQNDANAYVKFDLSQFIHKLRVQDVIHRENEKTNEILSGCMKTKVIHAEPAVKSIHAEPVSKPVLKSIVNKSQSGITKSNSVTFDLSFNKPSTSSTCFTPLVNNVKIEELPSTVFYDMPKFDDGNDSDYEELVLDSLFKSKSEIKVTTSAEVEAAESLITSTTNAEVETAEPKIISAPSADAGAAKPSITSARTTTTAEAGTAELPFIPVKVKVETSDSTVSGTESILRQVKSEPPTESSKSFQVNSEPVNVQIKSEDLPQSVNISNTPVCEKCEQLLEDCLEKDYDYNVLKTRTDGWLVALKCLQEAYKKLENDFKIKVSQDQESLNLLKLAVENKQQTIDRLTNEHALLKSEFDKLKSKDDFANMKLKSLKNASFVLDHMLSKPTGHGIGYENEQPPTPEPQSVNDEQANVSVKNMSETGDSEVSNGSCTEVNVEKKAVSKKSYSREEMFAVKKSSRAEKGKKVVVDGFEAENKNTRSKHQSTDKSSLSYSNKSFNKNFVKNDKIHKNFVNKVKPSSKSDDKQANGLPSHRGDRRTCFRCHEVGHVVYQCPMTSPSHAFVRSEVGPVVVNHFKPEKQNTNLKNSKIKNTSVNVKSFQHVNVKKDLPKHSYQRKANTVNNVSVKPTSVKVVDLDFKKLSYYVKQSPFTSYHWVASTKNAKSKPEKVFDEKENVVKETEFVTPDKHVISEESVSSNKVDPASSVNSDHSTHSVKSLDPEFSDKEKECFVTRDKPKRAWVSLFS